MICDWGEVILSAVMFGGFAFALHAGAYVWLMRRIGQKQYFGVLISVLPSVATAMFYAGENCIDMGIFRYSGLVGIAAAVINFLGFHILLWDRFKSGSSFAPLVTVISYFLAIPFFGPMVALVWLAASWGLPLPYGIYRLGIKNPPTTRRSKYFWIAFFLLIIGLLGIGVNG